MRPRLLVRKIHKWVGLLLGIQILLWFFSGFLMSWMPIEEIHGDHLKVQQQAVKIDLSDTTISAILSQIKEPIVSVSIKPWLNQTTVFVNTENQSLMFDAQTAEQLNPLNESQVSAVIAHHIKPAYTIKDIQLMTEVPAEARGRSLPLWQVQLNGEEDARIYVSADSGEIVATRTNRWRLFDFLWMLHIMDYDTRDDFNHPLLYLSALSALLFTISGFVLLFFGFKKPSKAK